MWDPAHLCLVLPARDATLTCPARLQTCRHAAGPAGSDGVDGDDPELVVGVGRQLQDDRVEVPRIGGQIPPLAGQPVVLVVLHQVL